MEKKRGLIFLFIVFFFLTFISLSTLQGLNEFSDEQLVEDYLSIGNLAYHEDPSKIIKKNLIFETGPEFVPGEIIVKFKDTKIIRERTLSEIPKIAELNKKHEAGMQKVFRSSKALKTPLANVYKIKLQDNADIQEAISDYLRSNLVEYAEPNYIYRAMAVPNDAEYSKQWAHQNMQSELGWDIEKGSEDVVIAIIDTGVDYTHKDLATNIWNNTDEIPNNGIDDDWNGYVDDFRGWDFVDVNTTSYEEYPLALNKKEDYNTTDNDPMDINGHGTYCSGIAGAVSNNSVGIAGTCWNCKIMPVKAMFDLLYVPTGEHIGYLENDDVVNAIIYAADNNASIISMSFGSYESSSLIKDALDYAYNNGVILIAAAGNEYTDDPLYPAAYNSVISVAATDQDDKKADFSNYGFSIDIAAPGVWIYTTKVNNAYEGLGGTSMSTAFVAGLTGLILSKNPNLTQDDVKQILRSSTDPVTSFSYIGTGRVNVYKALQIDLVPLANIIYPLGNDALQGMIEIKGTANGSSFQNYIVEYGKSIYPENWIMLENSTIPVVNDVLAVLNTNETTDGTYKIKLRVNSADGWAEDEIIIIVVNNKNTCYSCFDCDYKVDFPGASVILANDITYSGTCINFEADNVTFDCDNHNITGDYSYSMSGLYMENVSGLTIKNCNIMDYDYPAVLFNVSNSRIFNVNSNAINGFLIHSSSYNEFFNINVFGDKVWDYFPAFFLSSYSHDNKIFDSKVSSRVWDGLFIGYGSYNNTVFNTHFSYASVRIFSGNNTILNSTFWNSPIELWKQSIGGVYELMNAEYNTISGNNISSTLGTGYGIELYGGDYNVISKNNIIGNFVGIEVNSITYNNIISKNNIIGNRKGIWFSAGKNSYNTISKNNIVNNSEGISIRSQSNDNNKIYHNNIINNTNQVLLCCECLDDLWDNGKEGNYWSDYDSEEEGCFDTNKDGICDSPYAIISEECFYIEPSTSWDNYPFKQQNGWITIECIGDVNSDGKVNIFDLAKVGLCYGCSSAQACWQNCEQADVKPDGFINIFDLATVGLHYGQVC